MFAAVRDPRLVSVNNLPILS